ncbi:MAG: pentapeptide repeat-containing protein [Alphaproteobacteria bacterium]|nr:pentapeptide repeat-containing protein [Alphaproteobacteria bacterium]
MGATPKTNFHQLSDTTLGSANLQWAKLIGANFEGADIIGAVLHGADLTLAKGLTQAQLDQACGNEETKLPNGLTVKGCPGWSE